MVDAKEVLNDLAQRLRIAFPGEVKDVVLFGSQLTSKANEDSDYDFILVWKGAKLNWQKKQEINAVCFETDLKYGILTHTLLISEEELNGIRGAQPIYQDALEYGAHAA